ACPHPAGLLTSCIGVKEFCGAAKPGLSSIVASSTSCESTPNVNCFTRKVLHSRCRSFPFGKIGRRLPHTSSYCSPVRNEPYLRNRGGDDKNFVLAQPGDGSVPSWQRSLKGDAGRLGVSLCLQ